MPDSRPPVAVTGIGVISPIGVGREAFWRSLCAGLSGVVPRRYPSTRSGRTGSPVAVAEVHDFDAKRWIRSAHLRRMDRLSRMVVAASRIAVEDAGVDLGGLAPDRIGVVVGSSVGNVSESVDFLERVFTKGSAFASPMLFPNLVLNAPASYAAMELGATGVNLTVAHGEICGEQAILRGAHAIRSGRADLVLAGGGDELGAILVDIYGRARVLSGQRGGEQWSSPYDAGRSGLAPGEGAAMLALEAEQRARARGAEILALLDGEASFAVPAPAYDWPSRVTEVPEALRRLAAGLPPSLICGCANSSRRLDAFEAGLVTRLLGEGAGAATVTSIKGAVGEFGAAGALTTAAACLAVREQGVPPLCHLRRPLPGVRLRFAASQGKVEAIERALVLGIARGGAGAALSLRRANG
jgi:3-oxoacyl-[acyl-carrier-protein] synthase II